METVKKSQRLSPFLIWLAWTGGSLLAGVCALTLTISILHYANVNEDRWMGLILITTLVLLLGVAQALVLSLRLRHAGWWVVVSAAGCTLAILTFMLIAALASRGYLNPMGMTTTLTLMIYGACTGVVQWFYLRRHWSQAIWWIPASIIGWALLGIIIGRAFTTPLQITLLGFIPASVTGILVAWCTGHLPGGANGAILPSPK